LKKRTGELAGRVALVTGGSKGIGFAIAKALGEEGAKVVITARGFLTLRSARDELRKGGVECEMEALYPDLHKDPFAEVLFNVGCKFSKLDILVNNIGGVRQFSKFDELADEHWQEVFDANLMSMVRFSRVALPLLKKSDHASVVNIASVAGKRPGNFNPHYGAMKAAMIYLSKHLSNQWGKYGIRVNAIAPHTVKGGAWKRDIANKARMDHISVRKAEEAMLRDVASKVPLGVIPMPQDVANLAVFLASDRARLITGTCIMLDGGVVNSIF